MFDVSLMDASFLTAAVIAAFAGVMSFLSPCVLPIVPPYLAYMSGIGMSDLNTGRKGNRAALTAALFFVLGLSTVFMLLGFAASAFGQVFAANRDAFAMGAGIVVMVFGAHFLGVISIPFLNHEARMDAGDRGGSAFGAYVLGLAFAFGWTPCIGPQLAMILSLAAQDTSLARGAALLAIYAAGLGIPFLLVAAYLPRLTGVLAFFKRHMERIERTMGLLLWTIGLLMATGGFTVFANWLLDTFPAMASIG